MCEGILSDLTESIDVLAAHVTELRAVPAWEIVCADELPLLVGKLDALAALLRCGLDE